MKMEQILPSLRLLAVAGPPFVSVESAVESCMAAEAGGVTAVQLRWKNLAASELRELTEQLVDALTIPVWVNDRADVAIAGGAVGVHLGAEDIEPTRVRTIAPRPFRIGVSVGNQDEATAALGADVDYWSMGAIYPTDSKSDAGPPIGTDGFKRLASLAPVGMPVIAIGGINPSNVEDILRAGAQGVAVISSVFGSSNIEACARELRGIIESTL